jgi:hypothetical protein
MRPRPFQIKLETAKWGLSAGWHIIHVQSYDEGLQDSWIVWFPTGQTMRRILRLRHVGSRVPQGQAGYREPNYFDDNWELLGESNISFYEYWHGPWYEGSFMGGRGVYRPNSGLVVDSGNRDIGMWNDWYDEPNPPDGTHEHEFCHIECWDDGFYSHKEYSTAENQVPSPVMDLIRPWPGTSNGIYGAVYQGYDGMPIKNLAFFNPSSHSDDTPWAAATNILSCQTNWMLPSSNSQPVNTQLYNWTSNFFFVGISWHGVGDEYGYWPDPDNYIYFQGPNHWGTLNQIAPVYPGYNDPSLENSMWDWAWDCSCAESNFQAAYVRRKSDGSIWRFRNWKPTGNIYTDFPNLTMRPTEPVLGVEYASFFMNGPPIPGNETWNTLMVLK